MKQKRTFCEFTKRPFLRSQSAVSQKLNVFLKKNPASQVVRTCCQRPNVFRPVSAKIVVGDHHRCHAGQEELYAKVHPSRRTTANHAFGPPSEKGRGLRFGMASNRDGRMESSAQPSAKAS